MTTRTTFCVSLLAVCLLPGCFDGSYSPGETDGGTEDGSGGGASTSGVSAGNDATLDPDDDDDGVETAVPSTGVPTSGTATSPGSSGSGDPSAEDSSTGGDPAASAGVIIPLYTYPTDASWAAVGEMQLAHPTVEMIVIVNPSSGPGVAADPNYDAGIDMLRAVGVTVVGYVPTSYGTRAITSVREDIASYRAFYDQIDGIMFDEMSSDAAYAKYYSGLAQYTTSLELFTTVGNPGVVVPAELLGIFDTVFVYEAAGLPLPEMLQSSSDRETLAILPHSVEDLDPLFVGAALDHVGWIYVTNDTPPNPWDTLPPYFAELLDALAAG